MTNWMSPIVASALMIGGAIPALLSANLSFVDAFFALWLILFLVGFALIALEGAFFMRAPEIHRISQFVVAFAATGVTAAIAAAIVYPMSFELNLAETVSDYLAGRTVADWIVRLIGAAGLYTFLYAVIGSITWLFVRDFYQDPKHGLALRVPGGRIIIALQLFRGLVTTVALIPLFAAAQAPFASWWLRLALLLTATMAIGPLVMATRWPAKLRLIHAIEISVFALLYSFAVCSLIAKPGGAASLDEVGAPRSRAVQARIDTGNTILIPTSGNRSYPIRMSAEKRIVIHVGIHKTGSTSIQEFLRAHRMALQALDVDFYLGAFNPSNHVELHVAAIRLERDCPFKLNKGIVVDEAFRENVQTRVRQYIAQSQCDCVVFSAEGLSYLRYEDEMDRLKAMIPQDCIEIVIYLRDAAGFLASYRSEMTKHTMPPTIECDSFAYTGDDSWLVDFASRLASFRNAFGAQNVIALDYDHELRTAGTVIPSFLNVLGVASHFRPQDWNRFFLNPTQLDEKGNL